MSTPEAFTGERYLPGVVGEIAYEHCHRYAFARRYVAGRRVLDAACGEGYGSALLAAGAQRVVGVDIDAGVVAAAFERYADRGNLHFEAASVTALPLPDASVDVVVSFETIEHLDAADQPRMLAEFARVLAPDGMLILSSPNRPEYSDARGYANPFHRCELDRDELGARLDALFPAQSWFRQRRYMGSAIWGETDGDRCEALSGSALRIEAATAPTALYFIVIAARTAAALPQDAPALSLYADADDSEWSRIDHEAREVLRLDGELRDRQRDVQELRAMVEYRDRKLAEREHAYAQVERLVAQERATHEAERERLARQIETQERIVAYRASIRWWLRLPLVRARRAWTRIRAA